MNKDFLDDYVVIIPCLNPDDKLQETVKNIKNEGFNNIIIVNDGSSPKYDVFFQDAIKLVGDKGVLLTHDVNKGQGRAYKTAFECMLKRFPNAKGAIQCDSDGQHRAYDVKRCSEVMEQYPNNLVLGERNFDDPSVPFRSKFGNKCTSKVFSLFFHLDVADTQTGLKGIPTSLITCLIDAPGERYEFCSCTLLEAFRHGYAIRNFPIQTVYDKNNISHFNPIIDAIRIYYFLLKYYFSC